MSNAAHFARNCGHQWHKALIGQQESNFQTIGAAAYAPELCKAIANSLIQTFLTLQSSVKGEKALQSQSRGRAQEDLELGG
eukprot:3190998-Karenia_brevis.AAC.1